MVHWNVSINTYFGLGEHTRFSIRVWEQSERKGWVRPRKHVTGRLSLPPAADPTTALRALLAELLEQL